MISFSDFIGPIILLAVVAFWDFKGSRIIERYKAENYKSKDKDIIFIKPSE